MRAVLNTVALSAAVSAVLVLAMACGGDDAEPSGDSSPSSSSPAGGASTPSGAAASPGVPQLTETTTSQNGVTVRYPAGWAPPLSDIGVFLYKTADSSTALGLQRFKPGQLVLQINSVPVSGQQTDAQRFETRYAAAQQSLRVTLGTPSPVAAGAKQGLAASGKNDQMGVYVALVPVTATMYFEVLAYTAPDELASQVPLLQAIVGSVTVATR